MSEWAAVASTLIAAVGLLFAGGQVMIMNRAAAMERRIARDGVVVSWQPIEAPREAQSDGKGVWLYDVRVHTPGRMPVDDVVGVKEIREMAGGKVSRVAVRQWTERPEFPPQIATVSGNPAFFRMEVEDFLESISRLEVERIGAAWIFGRPSPSN